MSYQVYQPSQCLPPLGPPSVGAVEISPEVRSFYRLASTAGMAAGAYHGYRRHGSVGWAVAWGLLGGLFWPIAMPVAAAQGFAKPKR